MAGHPSGATCPECGVSEEAAQQRTRNDVFPSTLPLAGLLFFSWCVSWRWCWLMADWEPFHNSKSGPILLISAIYAGVATAATIAVIVLGVRLVRRARMAGLPATAAQLMIGLAALHMAWVLLLIDCYRRE